MSRQLLRKNLLEVFLCVVTTVFAVAVTFGGSSSWQCCSAAAATATRSTPAAVSAPAAK